MVEHLMFKGTETVPTARFRMSSRAMAATTTASPRRTIRAITRTSRPTGSTWSWGWRRIAWPNLAFTDDHFHTEREVVLEERRSRVDNHPAALFREQVKAAHYLNHPYGLPVVGWEHEIRALGAGGRASVLPRLVCAEQRGAGCRRRCRRGGVARPRRGNLRQGRGAPGPAPRPPGGARRSARRGGWS